MRVLLADDHVMIREGLKPFIERLGPGVEVLEAGTMADVFARLDQTAEVDLLILDLKMPGMNGLEGLEEVRVRHPNLSVVILSSVVDHQQMLAAIRAGAQGFIPKSLSGAAMVSALQLVLSGERFIPAQLLGAEAGPDHHGPTRHSDLLTPRERDILHLLKEGMPNKVIAAKLNVSEVTVKSHLGNVFRKLGVQNRVQALKVLGDRGDV